MWSDNSVARVLTRFARGPGFESRSGHMGFSPLWHIEARRRSPVYITLTCLSRNVHVCFRAKIGKIMYTPINPSIPL